MLEQPPGCERCGQHLDGDSVATWVCSYRCAWCEPCATGPLQRVCPNCGGELVRAPD